MIEVNQERLAKFETIQLLKSSADAAYAKKKKLSYEEIKARCAAALEPTQSECFR